MDRRRITDKIMTLLCWAAGLALTALVFFVLAFVFVRGYSVLSLTLSWNLPGTA